MTSSSSSLCYIVCEITTKIHTTEFSLQIILFVISLQPFANITKACQQCLYYANASVYIHNHNTSALIHSENAVYVSQTVYDIYMTLNTHKRFVISLHCISIDLTILLSIIRNYKAINTKSGHNVSLKLCSDAPLALCYSTFSTWIDNVSAKSITIDVVFLLENSWPPRAHARSV
jgi:hypothetical protein